MTASAIDLSHPDIYLFNETAKSFAKEMAYPELLQWNKRDRAWEVKHDKNLNKITQLKIPSLVLYFLNSIRYNPLS
jgi:hypothetical protein